MLRIRTVEALRRHRLRLTLTNGDVVERDVGPALWGPVFEPVRSDPSVFRAVRAHRGAIEWPGGADLDPDVLIWGGPPPKDPGARPLRQLRLGSRAARMPHLAPMGALVDLEDPEALRRALDES